MKVTTKIRIDLARSGGSLPVEAIQGDGNTRYVEISLFADGKPWNPSYDCKAAVTYVKPDNTIGLYDKLADGTPAVTIRGATACVILAPQILAVPGRVKAAVVFNNNRLDQLTTFPFEIAVARNQFAGAQKSEDFVRLQWLEDRLNEKIDELVATEKAVTAGIAAEKAYAAAAEAETAAGRAQEMAEAADKASERANTAASAVDLATTAASTAAAAAQSAAELADNAATAAQAVADDIVQDIAALNASNASLSDALTRNNAKLDILWKLNAGISYDFVTDGEEGYEKTVPAGSKYAAVESIGGHLESVDGALVCGGVVAIKYNGEIMGIIPDAVRRLPGYGWSAGDVCNSVEKTTDGWQYVQRVGVGNLGSANWTKTGSNRFYTGNFSGLVKPPIDASVVPNVVCHMYASVCFDASYAEEVDKSISVTNQSSYSRGNINVVDSGYSDAVSFKSAVSGILLYYELSVPIVTDITDLMADFPAYFAVESGGTLAFENSTNLSIPSTVKYLRSIKEAIA